MKFVDEAIIDIAAGDGGNGCVSFRHEKYKEFGGPNGGDGGRGGHVYALADASLNTLVDFRYSRRHEAKRGQHSMCMRCTSSKMSRHPWTPVLTIHHLERPCQR